jgi:hypothetical protein
MENPELKNHQEIVGLLSSDLQSKREMGIGLAMQNMSLGIVNTQHVIHGHRQTVGRVASKIEELNTKIGEYTASTDILGKRALVLSWVNIALTCVIAVATIIELFRKSVV